MSESKSKREKEEQYFQQKEMEKRKKLREKLDQEREEQKKQHLKEAHYMKCPKCGHDLEEICYMDVMVDKCTGCKGIYLDAGELELLLGGSEKKGFISRFLGSVNK